MSALQDFALALVDSDFSNKEMKERYLKLNNPNAVIELIKKIKVDSINIAKLRWLLASLATCTTKVYELKPELKDVNTSSWTLLRAYLSLNSRPTIVEINSIEEFGGTLCKEGAKDLWLRSYKAAALSVDILERLWTRRGNPISCYDYTETFKGIDFEDTKYHKHVVAMTRCGYKVTLAEKKVALICTYDRRAMDYLISKHPELVVYAAPEIFNEVVGIEVKNEVTTGKLAEFPPSVKISLLSKSGEHELTSVAEPSIITLGTMTHVHDVERVPFDDIYE